MDRPELAHLVGAIPKQMSAAPQCRRLTPAQKAELLNALSARDEEAEVGRLVDWRRARLQACLHCAVF